MSTTPLLRLMMVFALLLIPPGLAAGDLAKALNTEHAAYDIQGTSRQAFAEIARMGKIQIAVDWPALRRAEADLNGRITLKGRHATLEQILELLLVQIAAPRKPLGYYIENNTLHVTTQSYVLSRRTRRALAIAPPVRDDKKPAQKTGRTRNAPTPPGHELKFNNVPLSEVVQYFRDISGLNIHVNWRALQAVGVDKSEPVSFQARDITLAAALDLMLRGINTDRDRLSSIYWLVDKGVVQIATGEVFDREMRTVVMDVADLLAVVPDFKAPQLNLARDGGGEDSHNGGGSDLWEDDEENEEADEDLQTRQQETLIRIIKESIGEDMWKPTGKGSIRILSNRRQLVITQSLLGFKLMRQTLGN